MVVRGLYDTGAHRVVYSKVWDQEPSPAETGRQEGSAICSENAPSAQRIE